MFRFTESTVCGEIFVGLRLITKGIYEKFIIIVSTNKLRFEDEGTLGTAILGLRPSHRLGSPSLSLIIRLGLSTEEFSVKRKKKKR